MFSLLERVVRLQAGLRELPTRLEKDKLKELSQLDQRYYGPQLSRLSRQVVTRLKGAGSGGRGGQDEIDSVIEG